MRVFAVVILSIVFVTLCAQVWDEGRAEKKVSSNLKSFTYVMYATNKEW